MKKATRKMLSRAGLAVILSRLEGFHEPKVGLEQYATDSEIAASMLWNAYVLGDVKDSVTADLGCGTGILGIGAILLGARRVLFIDRDNKAIEIAKKNLSKVKSETLATINLSNERAKFIVSNVEEFDERVDTAIQNPPFGTRIRHSDIVFLKNATRIAETVYSIHKSETLEYIRGFIDKIGWEITHFWRYSLPLKSTYGFHSKRIKWVEVVVIRLCVKASK